MHCSTEPVQRHASPLQSSTPVNPAVIYIFCFCRQECSVVGACIVAGPNKVSSVICQPCNHLQLLVFQAGMQPVWSMQCSSEPPKRHQQRYASPLQSSTPVNPAIISLFCFCRQECSLVGACNCSSEPPKRCQQHHVSPLQSITFSFFPGKSAFCLQHAE